MVRGSLFRGGLERPLGPVALNRASPFVNGLVAWWPLGPFSDTLSFSSDASNVRAALEMVRGVHASNVSTVSVTTSQMGLVPSAPSNALSPRLEFSSTNIATAVDRSVSFWCKLRVATPTIDNDTGFPLHLTNAAVLADHYPWTDGTAYIGQFSETRYNFALSADVNRAEWHCVTITTRAGANGWRFFQNGQLVHSNTGPSTALLQVATGRLLSSRDSYSLAGWLADVRLWNRALSDAEVVGLFDPRTRWDLYHVPQRLWMDVATAAGGGFFPRRNLPISQAVKRASLY